MCHILRLFQYTTSSETLQLLLSSRHTREREGVESRTHPTMAHPKLLLPLLLALALCAPGARSQAAVPIPKPLASRPAVDPVNAQPRECFFSCARPPPLSHPPPDTPRERVLCLVVRGKLCITLKRPNIASSTQRGERSFAAGAASRRRVRLGVAGARAARRLSAASCGCLCLRKGHR